MRAGGGRLCGGHSEQAGGDPPQQSRQTTCIEFEVACSSCRVLSKAKQPLSVTLPLAAVLAGRACNGQACACCKLCSHESDVSFPQQALSCTAQVPNTASLVKQHSIQSPGKAVTVFMQLVRMPLAEAGPEVRMVESLQPMWDEEKLRIGSSPPAPPPEPHRSPIPLCQHVEVVRAQLQVVWAYKHELTAADKLTD